jgi:hypothetical protein
MAKNIIKKNSYKKTTIKDVNYEALVNLGELKDGLRIANIVSCEDVEVEGFIGRCKVQLLRDGHIQIVQLPKRLRNKPIFRDDNCTFTLGKDGRYYFVFTMPEQLIFEIPGQLRRQAGAIAAKIEEALAIKR